MRARVAATLIAIAFCVQGIGTRWFVAHAQDATYAYPFVLVATGDEGARADSVITAAFLNSDGQSLFSVVLKPAGTAWAKNTTVRAGGAGMKVDPALGASEIDSVEFILDQHPAGGETPENWDLLGIEVLLSQNATAPDNFTCGADADASSSGNYIAKTGGAACGGVALGQAEMHPAAALGMVEAVKCGSFDKPGKFIQLTKDIPSAAVSISSCTIIPPGAKQP
jgi:hypothetical protein